MSNWPEHDKMMMISHLSQNLHDFLEWLNDEKGYEIGHWFKRSRIEDEFWPITSSRDDLLYEFFDIDKAKFFQEKEDMLEELRKMNE